MLCAELGMATGIPARGRADDRDELRCRDVRGSRLSQ